MKNLVILSLGLTSFFRWFNVLSRRFYFTTVLTILLQSAITYFILAFKLSRFCVVKVSTLTFLWIDWLWLSKIARKVKIKQKCNRKRLRLKVCKLKKGASVKSKISKLKSTVQMCSPKEMKSMVLELCKKNCPSNLVKYWALSLSVFRQLIPIKKIQYIVTVREKMKKKTSGKFSPTFHERNLWHLNRKRTPTIY